MGQAPLGQDPCHQPHFVGSETSLAFHCRGYAPGGALGFRMDIFGFMGGFREEAVSSKNAEGKVGR